MTNPTEAVTQADKRLAATILGIIDTPIPVTLLDTLETAIARHRAQALAQGRLEGAEAGLKAAAGAIHCAHGFPTHDYEPGFNDVQRICEMEAQTIANQIGEK